MTVAYLYPGQGAQAVGMGRDLCEASTAARDIFLRAEEATGLPLKRLCFDGPEQELSRTDVAQPAIFTVSAAVMAAMAERLDDRQRGALRPAFAAGLSLGEYTALYAAGALDFETGVKLVAKRGQFMQDAAAAVPSGMVSVLGMDEAQAAELCKAAANGEVLTCANFNCPGQVVLSGQLGACERAAEMARQFGASGAVRLKVAGAFHSEIMAPAVEALRAVLAEIRFRMPNLTVLANVDAKSYDGQEQIPEKLLLQLVRPVRWQRCMEQLLAGGVGRFYEIGPGRVLAGLARRIDREAQVSCVNSMEDVEELADSVSDTDG